MTDLAVASGAFLDLTFLGLEALPGPGEARFARELLRSPGGGAITATGAARLGLDSALAVPLGSDEAGGFLRAALEAEGVRLVAPHRGRTATTVVLPLDGERAMVTYEPGVAARAEDLDALAPRAVVGPLGLAAEPPAGAALYVSCGDSEARAHAGRLPDLSAARALLVNAAEARLLTGARTAEEALRRLAGVAPSTVVTLGPGGAIALIEGREVTAEGVDGGPVIDTTGAGDLFTAAYVWADLHGAAPGARVRWATLYAALSVTTPTGTAGAVTEARLIEEGTRRGLPRHPVPAGHTSSSPSPMEG